MASSWRDLLPKVLAEREGLDVSAVSSVSPDNQAETAPNRPNRPNSELPAIIVAGVGALRDMPCPANVRPEAWGGVVRDAISLADVWAVQALGLGWSALDLFGAITDSQADPDADGLAVKLSGRKVLAICASFATVADANGGRSYLYKGGTEGSRLLWALGRGR